MIISEKKPFAEILSTLEGMDKIFLIGCADCATLCGTGGEAEIEEMRLKLEKSGKTIIGSIIYNTPCHVQKTKREMQINKADITSADALLVLSCGAGVQSISEVLPDKYVLPALNSLFLGNVKRYGFFEERCSMCGECVLSETMGICPVTRCAKGLVNGPCGGSINGRCEVIGERECAWALIFEKFKKSGKVEQLEKYQPMKDFEITIKPGTVDIRSESQDERADRMSHFKEQKNRIRSYFQREVEKNKEDLHDEMARREPASRLEAELKGNQFVYTCEIVPPKGVNFEKTLEHGKKLRNCMTAFSINENPGSIMRIGSLSMSALFAQEGLEPILHLTTRERNRLALQSELLGAYVLGVRNVLGMTGDHQSVGDHKEAKPVYDLDSVQLIRLATELTRGRDYNGNPLDGAPNFFIGGVVNPGSDQADMQFLKMKKKANAGAEFFITQAIYDTELLKRFMERIDKEGIKAFVIAGIIPLKSRKMAEYMNANIPGIKVPEKMIERIDNASNKKAVSAEMAREIIEQCKGITNGVHIMPIGWYDLIPDLVDCRLMNIEG